MPEAFIALTSVHNTLLYIRRDIVLYIEGYTMQRPIKNMTEEEPATAEHIGTRLTLLAGQYSEAVVCLEPVDEVHIKLVRGF